MSGTTGNARPKVYDHVVAAPNNLDLRSRCCPSCNGCDLLQCTSPRRCGRRVGVYSLPCGRFPGHGHGGKASVSRLPAEGRIRVSRDVSYERSPRFFADAGRQDLADPRWRGIRGTHSQFKAAWANGSHPRPLLPRASPIEVDSYEIL